MDIYPKEMKTYVYAKIFALMLKEALPLIAKYWKHPTYPSVSEEFYKFRISKQYYYSANKNTTQQIKRKEYMQQLEWTSRACWVKKKWSLKCYILVGSYNDKDIKMKNRLVVAWW